MESVTIILEIAIAVLLAAIVISVLFVYFRNSAQDMRRASQELVDTTSDYSMVILKQYDNTELNGYDVRYAVKHFGTTSSTSHISDTDTDSKKPNDFFVCIKFKDLSKYDVKRKVENKNVAFIIPNKYETLDDSKIKVAGSEQLLDYRYVAPEATFRSHLLKEGLDPTESCLQNLGLQIINGFDVESDDVVGIYLEEI